jgi:hypothetical protein
MAQKRSWPNLKVQLQHLPGGTEQDHLTSQDSQSPGRDLNPGPPEYEVGLLATRLRCSVPTLYGTLKFMTGFTVIVP